MKVLAHIVSRETETALDVPSALADKSTLACKADELNDIMSRDAIGAATVDV
jgi:hypothetical protein